MGKSKSLRMLAFLLILALLLPGLAPMTARAEENPFVDVSEEDYFYDAVLWAYYHEPQITTGMDAKHFGPERSVTRGQAVTFLWRAVGCPEPLLPASPFEDVTENKYFYKPVLWAMSNGITRGTDTTHFSPEQTCSSAHIITFLFRSLGIGRDGWYEEAAAWAEKEGLLRGAGLEVDPRTECPRGAVVLALYNAIYQPEFEPEPEPEPTAEPEPEPTAEPEPEPTAEPEPEPTAEPEPEPEPEPITVSLSADKTEIPAGEETAVTFTVTANLPAERFTLLLEGRETAAELLSTASDGVYTGTLELLYSSAMTLSFTAQTVTEEETWVTEPWILTVTDASGSTDEQAEDAFGPSAAPSTEVTPEDSCVLSSDRVDVPAGTPTELYFTVVSTLWVDGFRLLADGEDLDVLLTDEDEDGTYTGSYTLFSEEDRAVSFTARASAGTDTAETNACVVLVTSPLAGVTEDKVAEVLGEVESLLREVNEQNADAGLSEKELADHRFKLVYGYLLEQESKTAGATAYAVPAESWVHDVHTGSEETGDEYVIYYSIGDIPFSVSCFRDPEIEGGGSLSGLGAPPVRLDSAGWNLSGAEKVIVLSYYEKTETTKTMLNSALACGESFREMGFDVTERYDVTIDSFKDLEDYAIICVRSHGTTRGGVPVICTHQRVTDENRKTYAAEIKNDLVSITSETDGNSYYYIRPAFFDHYYKDAGKSLSADWVHLGMCKGLFNHDLADALMVSGADTVTGFTQSVFTSYSTNMIAAILEHMGRGEDIASAVAAAKQLYGADDGDTDKPAVLEIAGDETTLLHERLRNGRFEFGFQLFSWTFRWPKMYWGGLGDSEALTRFLGNAAWDRYMWKLSTGSGAYNDGRESLVYQTIHIPEDAETLSFYYRVYTEEFSRGPARYRKNDFFRVDALDMNGDVVQNLHTIRVLDYERRFTNPSRDIHDGRGCWDTGWYKRTVSVKKLRGRVITLCFWVRDEGDSNYDTAVLVDNIEIR